MLVRHCEQHEPVNQTFSQEKPQNFLLRSVFAVMPDKNTRLLAIES
jgi:hypothetical protein